MVIIINLDPRSSTPIYQQIVNGIMELIIKEILLPGDKLPSVRELSVTLTTNPNTVSKAYSELERLKIIETLRGRGTFVSSDYKPKVEEERMLKLKDDLKKLVMDAYYMGFTKDELVVILDEVNQTLLGNKNNGGKINE